jgi:hypothetical protein
VAHLQLEEFFVAPPEEKPDGSTKLPIKRLLMTEGAMNRHMCLALAAFAFAIVIPANPALAQFVCVDTTGSADGASALGTGSVACGTNATANDGDGTAVGSNANAVGDDSTAVGADAGLGAAAGNGANTAVGANSGQDVDGSFNTAIGMFSHITVIGDNNTASGASSGGSVEGSANTATGYSSGGDVNGDNNTASGVDSGINVRGNSNAAYGDSAGQSVNGNFNTAIGASAGQQVDGDNNVAIGFNAGSGTLLNPLTASDTISIGTNSLATGDASTAVGYFSSAAHANSTALGAGATTTRANQVMMGTSVASGGAVDTTYTMAGIATDASKTAQGAPTHIVTSNGGGDLAAYTFAELGLATQGDVAALQGDINRLGRRDKELTEGLAAVASLAQPILLPGQHFAMRAGWGGYDDANAVGFSAAGVVAKNLLNQGRGTLTLDGGVGFGTNEGELAGRAGMSFGW